MCVCRNAWRSEFGARRVYIGEGQASGAEGEQMQRYSMQSNPYTFIRSVSK
jgi:hypothetical protein